MRSKGIIWAAILFAFLANATFAEQAGGTASSPSAIPLAADRTGGTASPQAQAAVQQMMTGPSVFIENQGQWGDSDIKFALDSRGMNVGLTDKGPRFQLFRVTTERNLRARPNPPLRGVQGGVRKTRHTL